MLKNPLIKSGDTSFGLQYAIDRMRSNLHIAVVHGGNRLEEGAVIHPTRNPRSDKTYEGVAIDIADALLRLGFDNVELMPEDMRLGERLKEKSIDFVWLNTGGTQGYGSACHACAMLELFGIPYLGHHPLNAALLDNKHAFKHMLDGMGFLTPNFVVCGVDITTNTLKCTPAFEQVFSGHSGGFVVKPVSGRASLHVHFVSEPGQALATAKEISEKTGNLVMIEAFIPGDEYTIAVSGPVFSKNRQLYEGDTPFVFSPLKRLLAPEEFICTSMDIRPVSMSHLKVLDAKESPDLVNALGSIAKRIYAEFELRTAVRIDLRADHEGNLYVLEANPKPDLKRPFEDKVCLVAAGLNLHGMDYDDLILSLIANRLHYLIKHRSDIIPHIMAMLK